MKTFTPTRIQRFVLLVAFGLLVGALCIRAMESDREEHLAILDQDREQLKTQNRQLNAANRALSEELKSLEEGWGWIDVARKNHGMIRSGEMVFRFPDKSVALRGEPRPR